MKTIKVRRPFRQDSIVYISIDEKEILEDYKLYLPELDSIKMVTLHATGGRYSQPFGNYQILIDEKEILVSTEIAFYLHPHTYKRNTGNIGISFMAMYDSHNLITARQIENGAKAVAVVMKRYNINIDEVFDHAHFSKLDKYPPAEQRSDISLYKIPIALTHNTDPLSMVKNKAVWYSQKYLNN